MFVWKQYFLSHRTPYCSTLGSVHDNESAVEEVAGAGMNGVKYDRCPRCNIVWSKTSSVASFVRTCTCGLEYRGSLYFYQELAIVFDKFRVNWWFDRDMCQVLVVGRQPLQLPLLPLDVSQDDVEKYMVLA